MTLCPRCSDELDGFAPCACALDDVASRARARSSERVGANGSPIPRGGMRAMVARKLGRSPREELVGDEADRRPLERVGEVTKERRRQ